jgi:hypothetical protein
MDRMLMTLVALAITVGGVLSFWSSNLIGRRLSRAENVTIPVTCQSALFKFYSGSYNKTSKMLYLVLENKRSIDLSLEKIYVLYSDKMLNFTLNQALAGNMLKSIVVNNVESGFISGEIKTNCPDVTASFRSSQISQYP